MHQAVALTGIGISIAFIISCGDDDARLPNEPALIPELNEPALGESELDPQLNGPESFPGRDGSAPTAYREPRCGGLATPEPEGPQSDGHVIDGRGYFMVEAPPDRLCLTRRADMVIQPDGMLVSPWGLPVLGYTTASRFDDQRELTTIEIPTWDPGAQTTDIHMEVNFDAPLYGSPFQIPFDPDAPVLTAAFTQDLSVYDSETNRRAVTMYFAAASRHPLGAGTSPRQDLKSLARRRTDRS